MNTRINKQSGGIVLGVIIGVLVGLGVAFGVAMYIMKVPAPFSTKNAPRSAEQDKLEAKKNKDWDPNATLSGVKPPADAASEAQKPSDKPADKPSDKSNLPVRAEPVEAQRPGTAVPTPASTAKSPDEFVVQMGAFTNKDEATAQRAKLALAGIEVSVEERDQSGRMVYRLRSSASDRATADKLKERANASGFDALVVKVQK